MDRHISKVKISDIAQRAGVSPGTVDRVIHNRDEVSAKTRNKVMEIMREMNYKPDILASILASRKTIRFASLIPEATDDSLFWMEPAKGLGKALEQVKHYGIDHEIFFYNYFDKTSFKSAIERVKEWSPDGIVLAPLFPDLTADFVAYCQDKVIQMVFINMNYSNIPKLSFVGQDALRSGMVAARLLDLGMNTDDALIIVNIMNDKVGNKHLLTREEGFRSYFLKSDGAYRRELRTIDIHSSDKRQISAEIEKAILTEGTKKKPAGIFVTNSRVFHVADFLEKNSGTEIRLVGYDLLEANIRHLRNNLIDFLISQNPVEQGYRSFMALFETLVLKKVIPVNQCLPIDIITKENIDYYLTDRVYEQT
jgi:LacI family transcriptional regulator